MSKALITEDYLTDIADAIRAKNGSSNTYTPGQMAEAISALVDVDLEQLSVTRNGTYTAPTGKAYSPVVVNVSGGSSEPDLPSEYQRVEYLDFTPSIGILVTIPTTGVVLYTAEFSTDTSGERPAFAYRASTTNNKDFEIGSKGDSSILSYMRSPGASRGLPLNDGAEYTVGTKGTASIILIDPRSTALIGKYAHYQASSVDGAAFDGKIYGVKGTNPETNNITAWFVPCYRKSDNQVGMYDHIAQAFYSETYAVGSGYSIVAGPDMN